MIPKYLHRLVLVGVLLITGLALLTGCQNPFEEEQRYISTVFNHSGRTLKSVNHLNDLSGKMSLTDEQWARDVEREVANLRSLIAEARAMQPPQRFESFHNSYLEKMDSLEGIADLFEQAVELQSNETLQEGIRRLEQAEQAIDSMQERIKSLKEDIEKLIEEYRQRQQ
jgi:cell fate (sporulation/competence/biofilm development) regulator YmcA (YheA/YmcA/DUF963 family)